MRPNLALLVILVLRTFWYLPTSYAQNIPSALSPIARSTLRFKLENIANELELIVRNERSDRMDVERQKREFEAFDVFRTIPLASSRATPDAVLGDPLKKAASRSGVTLSQIQIVEVTGPDRPIPASLPTDTPEFKLTDDQLVEHVRLALIVTADKGQLQRWMDHWGDVGGRNAAPYLEWDPEATTSFPEPLPGGRWKLRAQAYLFRDIRFPKLVPRDPTDVLPLWARRDPALFRSREPLLAGLVDRAHAFLPKALPLFPVRELFMLNTARMDYFIDKFRGTTP